MSREFVRYALYFLPAKGSSLEDFGVSWLGWSLTVLGPQAEGCLR